MVDPIFVHRPARRLVRLSVAVLLTVFCGPITSGIGAALSPNQVAILTTDIKPAMDLLLAPVDSIFADGFE